MVIDFSIKLAELINGGITLVAGGFAYMVYYLKKSSEKRNAAIIVLMDIRHAEQIVQSILEKGAVDINLKNILLENNWGKYKHLFASDFSYDDFAAFNRYFDSCVEISDARQRIMEVFLANLTAKASVAQQKLLDISNGDTPGGREKREAEIKKINAESFTFAPDEPTVKIFQSVQLMGRLSNTVAFEKLRRLAKL